MRAICAGKLQGIECIAHELKGIPGLRGGWPREYCAQIQGHGFKVKPICLQRAQVLRCKLGAIGRNLQRSQGGWRNLVGRKHHGKPVAGVCPGKGQQ